MSDPIICPNCGRPFDAADPCVRKLSPAAYAAYRTLRTSVKNGQRLGVSRMASIVGVQHPSLYPHLRQMIAANLMERIPKRPGGTYYVYRLTS